MQALVDERPPKCKSLELGEGPLRRLVSETDGPRLVLVGDGARASESEAVFNMVPPYCLHVSFSCPVCSLA